MVTGSGAGTGRNPRVFISYAHDSPGHRAQVDEFGRLLRRSGIDARWDRHLVRTSPVRRDWSTTVLQEITDADYVLVVASPEYRRVGDGIVGPTERRGLQTEVHLLRDRLSDDRPLWQAKILPVLLPGSDRNQIPSLLSPHNLDHFPIADLTSDGLADLRRYLFHPPPTAGPAPPIGSVDPAIDTRRRRTRRRTVPGSPRVLRRAVRSPWFLLVVAAALLAGLGYQRIHRQPPDAAGRQPAQRTTAPPTAAPSAADRSTEGPGSGETTKYLAELPFSSARGQHSGFCWTGGQRLGQSLLLTVADGVPGLVELQSSPAGLTRLTGQFGPADTPDASQRRQVTIEVRTGRTGSAGGEPVRKEVFPYGASRQFSMTVRPGEYLGVLATADGPATACLGDVRLDP